MHVRQKPALDSIPIRCPAVQDEDWLGIGSDPLDGMLLALGGETPQDGAVAVAPTVRSPGACLM